jgi:hypothetical protein
MIRKNTASNKTSLRKISQNVLSQGQLTEEIRKVAQQLYEKRGCVQGKELDDWLEAERLVKERIAK